MRRAARTFGFIEHIRGEAIKLHEDLATIQTRLNAIGIERTVARIFDALLWVTEPRSELAPMAAVIARWRDEDGID